MKKNRKLKRELNHLHKQLSFGKYFIDCNHEPCIVTENLIYPELPYHSNIIGRRLLSGQETSCSIMHCDPQPISKELALEMVQYIQEYGWYAYLKKYLKFTDEALDYYRKMDDTWKFTRDIPESYLV